MIAALVLLGVSAAARAAAPLLARKDVLAELIGAERSPVLVSEHLETDGARMFAETLQSHFVNLTVASQLTMARFHPRDPLTWQQVVAELVEVVERLNRRRHSSTRGF